METYKAGKMSRWAQCLFYILLQHPPNTSSLTITSSKILAIMFSKTSLLLGLVAGAAAQSSSGTPTGCAAIAALQEQAFAANSSLSKFLNELWKW